MSIKKDSNLQYQIFYRGHLSPARTSGPFSIDTGVTGHEAFPSQSALHGEASQPGHTDRTPAPSLASSTSRPQPPLHWAAGQRLHPGILITKRLHTFQQTGFAWLGTGAPCYPSVHPSKPLFCSMRNLAEIVVHVIVFY